MKNFLDADLIQAINLELGIEPAFIEKDWYTVQLLHQISKLDFNTPELSHMDITLIFGGGTSLSKAYNITNRFSEDMDFLLYGNKDLSRNNRRQVKKSIHNKIKDMSPEFPEYPATSSDVTFAGNESNYFGYYIPYSKTYDHTALRADLKIEVTHETTILKPQIQTISSFVAKFLGEPENIEIPCVSAVEISGNKLSALCWRILSTTPPEPQIVRHLHDLAYLHKEISIHQENFAKVFTLSIQKDQNKVKRAKSLKLPIADTYKKHYNNLRCTPLFRPQTLKIKIVFVG